MKILDFGSLNLDSVYDLAHIVKPGETISSTNFSVFCGGKGLNQSIALARAGAQVYLAGSIGPDGGMLRAAAADSGVDVSLLREVDTPTGNALIQRSAAGENSIILYGGANRCNDEAYMDAVLAHFQVGDMLLLQNEINGLATLMQKAAARGMRIALNPSPYEAALRGCPLHAVEFFLLNEIEGRDMTGEADPDAMLGALRAQFPHARFVLTLGGLGVRYWDGAALHAHGIYDVKVVDTTGAGDTFTGYFLTAVSEGLPAERALELASKAAGLAVSVGGAVPSIPTRQAVEAWQGSLKS